MLLSILFFSLLLMDVRSDVSQARIYVDPQEASGNVGETFDVDIKVENARDLYSYELKLSWEGAILNATDIVEGEFPGRGGVYNTLFFDSIFNGPDSEGGDYIYIVNTLYAKDTGEDGGGTLATVTFTVERPGETILDLYGVMVIDSFGYSRACVWEDGYFNVSGLGFQVDPMMIADATLTAGSMFSVNITLSQAVEVYGFAFNVGYDQTLLNTTQVSILPFLENPQNDFRIFNEEGYVWASSNSSTSETVEDPTPVATIAFEVLGEGSTILNVWGTRLDDSLSRIPHTPAFEHTPPGELGYFSNVPMRHDIAITRVRVSPDEATVGEEVGISVTIKNLGGFNETFDVTVKYDGETIELRTDVFVESGETETLMFAWDTTDVSAGTYTVTAEASGVEDEDITENNASTDSVEISEGPGPGPNILDLLPYIIIVVVIIVAIVVAVYFMRGRKP
jgi:general secretion pathway protein D